MIQQSLANNTGMIKSPIDNPQVFISANVESSKILGMRFTEVEALSLLTTVTYSWQFRLKEKTKSHVYKADLIYKYFSTFEGLKVGETYTGLEALFIQKLNNRHANWQVHLLTQK